MGTNLWASWSPACQMEIDVEVPGAEEKEEESG